MGIAILFFFFTFCYKVRRTMKLLHCFAANALLLLLLALAAPLRSDASGIYGGAITSDDPVNGKFKNVNVMAEYMHGKPPIRPRRFNSDFATIFVSIASYRDYRCGATLFDVFAQAAYPQRIAAAIVEQRNDVEEFGTCVNQYCSLWWRLAAEEAAR